MVFIVIHKIKLPEVLPLTAITFEQLVRFRRAPRARGIIWKFPRRQSTPDVKNWFNDLPACFDHIGPLEQRGVADHAIEEQAFVARRDLIAKMVEIVKVHIDRTHLYDRSWDLCSEVKRNALVGLDMNNDTIRPKPLDTGLAKQHERSFLEMDDDARMPRRHSFARTYIKWNVGPTPVIDRKLESGEGFRVRQAGDVWFGTVRLDGLLIDLAFVVLAADRAVKNVLGCERRDSVEYLGLLIAHSVCLERDRRLHRRQRHELQDVIRDHVAQGSGRIVITATLFNTELLCDGDLDVVHVVAIPDRLEDAVAKSKNEYVLHRLFAEVMIDAIDLLLFDQLEERSIKLLCRLKIAAERLLVNESPPVAVLLFPQPVLDDLLRDVGKQCRRRCEIKEKIVGDLMLGSDVADQRLEVADELLVVVEVAARVVRTLFKPAKDLLIRLGYELSEIRDDLFSKFFDRHLLTADADHGERMRQKVFFSEIVESREELAFCQVARRAKDDHDARIGGFLAVCHFRHCATDSRGRTERSDAKFGSKPQLAFIHLAVIGFVIIAAKVEQPVKDKLFDLGLDLKVIRGSLALGLFG